MKRFVWGVVVLLLSVRLVAQESEPLLGRWCAFEKPVTESSLDIYRAALLRVVRARDLPALVGLAATEVRFSGNRVHMTKVISDMRLEDKSAPFWSELEEILQLGGKVVSRDLFCAPFVSCPVETGQLEELAVVREGAELRTSPGPEGRVVRRLKCNERVRIPEGVSRPASLGAWVPVQAGSPQWLWTDSRAIRGTAGWYIVIGRTKGEWRLVEVGGGD